MGMAMTILNNSATIMTLGELNKNITKVGKSLTKTATGQKINSAADDSASFGISEKMRAKIRDLEQDVQNVQNGSSLLKTALGGIQNIVDELRDLKELAIDAANDSNSDADRAIMQKVLKQKQANIDEIATTTTFNTKSMLDGEYKNPHWEERYYIRYDDRDEASNRITLRNNEKIKYLTLDNGEIITGQNTKSGETTDNKNISVIETINDVKGLASAFEAMPNSITFLDGTSSVETKDTALYSLKPLNIRDQSTGYIVPDRNFIRSTGGAPIAVRMDFSGARTADNEAIFDNNGHASSANILKLDGQGISLLFSDSSRNVTIKFDASKSGAETVFEYCNKFQSDTSDNSDADANTGDIEYRVGIQDLNRENGVTKEEFSEYIFNAIGNCWDRRHYAEDLDHRYNLQDNAGCTIYGDVVDTKNPTITSGESTYINYDSFVLSQKHNLRMTKDNNGNYYITAYQRYSHSLGILDDGWLGRAVSDEEEEWWKFKVLSSDSSGYTVASVREKYEYKEFDGNPLWVQHGTKANQHTNIFIGDMRNSAMMTDVADVSTRDRAIASIDYFDVAIEYALNEASNVGAYLQRMEYTESNIVVESENAQAAESTIRDADMAKEMTEYTKNNVLSQAAQSMLAHANQNMSSVLNLLQ